jgi:ABC-type glycerol-3-phosphate transport system permease component/peptidoglycan/LPS O-acetylase OafA/YrhL
MYGSISVKQPQRRVSKQRWWPYAFIAPFFILLIGFGLFPILFTLWVSLMEWNPASGVGAMRWSGFWAYDYVLCITRCDLIPQASRFWPPMAESLRIGFGSAVPQQLLAIPLAFAIHLGFRRYQGVLGSLLFLPYLASPVVAGAVLRGFFAGLLGGVSLLESILPQIPLLHYLPSNALYGWFSQLQTGFVQAWHFLGWNVLLYLMALNTIPKSLYEAAQIDGANLWQQFSRISLPLLRPMIFVAFTMSFTSAMQSGPMGRYVTKFGFEDFDMGLASAATVLFLGVTLGIVLVTYALMGRRFTGLETSAASESDNSILRLKPSIQIGLGIGIGIALVLAILPLWQMFSQITQPYYGLGSPSQSLNLGPFLPSNLERLQEAVPLFWRNLWNSTYIAGLAMLASLLLCPLAGYAFALLEFRHREKLFAAVLVTMLFPPLLSLIPTVLLMGQLGWIDQPRALWVPAMANAVGIFILRQYIRAAVPKNLLEAARMDGASEFAIFWRVVLPLCRPALATVGVLTFVTVWTSAGQVLVLLRSPETYVIQQALSGVVQRGQFGMQGLENKIIGETLALIPMLLIFALLARQFAAGLGLGSEAKRWGFGQLRDRVASLGFRVQVPASTIAGADGIRAMACLMVVFHHLAQRLKQPEQTPMVQTIQSFLMSGSVGVSAFFVLSGMLLSLPFWRRYLAGKPFPGLRDFYIRRAARILPGFFTSLVVSFLLGLFFAASADEPWTRFLAGLSLFSSIHYLSFFPAELNGPLWSVSFEVICYFLMPLAMWGMFGFSKRSFALGLLFWAGVFLLVLDAHSLILTHLRPGDENRGWQYGLVGGAKYWMPNYNPIGMFGHYLLGVLAAGWIAFWQQRKGRAGFGFDVLALLGLLGMMALLWQVKRAPEFTLSWGQQPYWFPYFPALVALMLATLPFSRWLGRLFDNAFFRYTAKVSFGLYIWHFLILELVRIFWREDYVYFGISSLNQHLWVSLVALLLAYGAASLSYRYIEAPFLAQKSSASR